MVGTLHDPVRVMRRALKFAKNASRPILCAVHLDESGDVVSTDTYRLFAEGAWDGPSMDLDYATAYDISKCKVKNNETASIERDGEKVVVKMADGTELTGAIAEGTYPDYRQLLDGAKPKASAWVPVKQVEPILKAHSKGTVRVDVFNRDVVISGVGDPEPACRFDKAADGEDAVISFNADYLRDALSVMGDGACIGIEASTKPAVVSNGDGIDVLLMPVRMDAGKPSAKVAKGMRKAPKSEEPEIAAEVGSLKGERVCITGKLAGMTRSEAFSRLKIAGGIPSEKFTSKVTMLVVAADAGRDKREKAEKAIAKGQKVRVVSGTEFVKALMKQGKTAGEKKMEEHMAKKMEEHMAKKVEKVNREGLSELLYALAIDRAAKEPDNRLTEGNASPNSATYVWRLQKEGRLKKEEHGEFTSWYLDGDFITCIERRYSQRKVRLHYPEIKPAQHKEDVVMKRRTEQKLTEHGVKAEVKVAKVDDGITAVTIEPPKPEKKQPPKAPAKPKEKEDEGMKKRIAELEAQLKATRAELETVWKENEVLKAKPEPKPVEVAATVSLSALTEQMQAWCKDRENVSARRKNEQLCTPVRVEGDTKPYKDELTELGFRYSKKGFWYYGEKEAQKQGKRVVA